MPRARNLKYLGVRLNKGKCQWRLDFDIDDIPYSAFYSPPTIIKDRITEQDVGLLAIPLIIDLVAEVKPRQVIIQTSKTLIDFSKLYRDAVSALLNEQSAEWNTKIISNIPPLCCEWRAPKQGKQRENDNEVVIGFSGGKDSIVSIFALLEAGYHVHPFLLNEGDRTWQQIRKWISKLKQLGLNPVTSYFLTSRRKRLHIYDEKYLSCYEIGFLVAAMSIYSEKIGVNKVVLGIENSPEKSGFFYGNSFINHQHQKTVDHLKIMEQTLRNALDIKLQLGSPIATVSDSETIRILLERVPRNFHEFSSCGGANSNSKHCGCCAKCAFVFALLQKSKKGRKLAMRLFRSDLFCDVEIYRPWLDDRYRFPNACIGEKDEVRDAFEANLITGTSKPVIEKWRLSTVRKKYLEIKKPKEPPRQNKLVMPIISASQIVNKWKT